MDVTPDPERTRAALRLHTWLQPPVLSLAVVVAMAGFGQFGVVAALADVAEEFGEVAEGEDLTLAEQAGLSGTTLGLGLAIIRLAAIGSLPLSGVADRAGRRRTLLGLATVGLGFVVLAALSPSYWWFVMLFALSRPLLTASNAVATVGAAEHTSKDYRAWAVALLAAAFGVGAGLFAVIRGLTGDAVGFRPLFGSAAVAIVLVAVASRWIGEPHRYRIAEARADRPLPVLGAVAPRFRSRLMPVLALGFAIALVTGPANSFVFLYAERLLGLSQGVTAALVMAAGVTGLVGLLIGRWAADHLGRRITGAVGLVATAGAGLVTYSGSVPGVVVGYLLAVMAGSVFAPAAGSLQMELFPTSVRGTVAGWAVGAGVLGAGIGLVTFGAIADHFDRFDLAAVVVFAPAALLAVLFTLLPETRGRELEETAAE